MGRVLLGIDVGTSGVKAGLFDAAGRLLGLGRAAHRAESPRPGWAQSDPEVWWRGIVAALGGAVEAAGVRPADVGAVGLGVLFPCVVPMAADGRALYPCILYNDRRSLAQVRAIERAVGRDEYQAAIGNMLVPGTCAATSMAWLRDEQPEAYAGARALGFANTFLTHRLTGEFCADPTMAGLSGLALAGDLWQWSGDLCERLGIDAALLPRIAGSAEVIGRVTGQAAGETGLREGTPVVCGAGDVVVSALGGGARSADTCVCVTGSTDCAALPLPYPVPDRRWANTAYIERDTWLGIGATTSTGAAVEWFAREVLGESGADRLRLVTELAAASRPGSGGLLFLPYLQGERAPVWDPLARGAFVGLTAATTRADMARAVLEGVAFAVRQVIECAGDFLDGPFPELRAVGGPTRNDLWNQIKADVLRRPLGVVEFQETGALGAALLAGMGAGVYASVEEAVGVARAAGPVRTVEPDPERAASYQRAYEAYCRLYPALAPIAHSLGGEA
jgi:xylulokinase